MGSIVFSGVSPHPPILVPEIGKGEINKCLKSRRGIQALSQQLAETEADALVLITPHGPVFYDALSVYAVSHYEGDFRQFGAPEIKIEAPGCQQLAYRILEKAKGENLPVLELNETSFKKYGITSSLDHATMVPLYYFKEAGVNLPLVLVSIGFLPYRDLFRFGGCVRKVINDSAERVAVIASGDLSHRLIPTAPAGYDPIGKEFDQKMIHFLENHDAEGILKLDENLIERAGECGFRPILIMLGATEGMQLEKELISYEGPFGVGYGVVAYTPKIGVTTDAG